MYNLSYLYFSTAIIQWLKYFGTSSVFLCALVCSLTEDQAGGQLVCLLAVVLEGTETL